MDNGGGRIILVALLILLVVTMYHHCTTQLLVLLLIPLPCPVFKKGFISSRSFLLFSLCCPSCAGMVSPVPSVSSPRRCSQEDNHRSNPRMRSLTRKGTTVWAKKVETACTVAGFSRMNSSQSASPKWRTMKYSRVDRADAPIPSSSPPHPCHILS